MNTPRRPVVAILLGLLLAAGLVGAQPGPARDGDRAERPPREALVESVRSRLERAEHEAESLRSLLERLESGASVEELREEVADGVRRRVFDRALDVRRMRDGVGRHMRNHEADPPSVDEIMEIVSELDPEMHERMARLRENNPERFDAFIAERAGRFHEMIRDRDLLRMRQEHRRIDEQIRAAKDAGDQDRLRQLVEEQFDLRMSLMTREIDMLERRLDDLRERESDLDARRDELVSRRVEEILSGDLEARPPRDGRGRRGPGSGRGGLGPDRP